VSEFEFPEVDSETRIVEQTVSGEVIPGSSRRGLGDESDRD
jgi:hypothetical protein